MPFLGAAAFVVHKGFTTAIGDVGKAERGAETVRTSLERVRTAARPGLRVKYVALGVVVAFVVAFVLSGIVGFVMYQGWLSESYSSLVMNIVSFSSLFVGGLYAGRRAGSAGWAHGALSGLTYVLVVTLLGLAIFDQLAPLVVLLGRTGLAVLLGAVAGTVGINLRD